MAGISVEGLNAANVSAGAESWEKILRKLNSGQMPPPGLPRPDAAATKAYTAWLESSLDRVALDHPNPGRPAIHRLNRAEYGNAVRDLLSLNIDAGTLLPPDDSGYGFDNIADVLSVSPVLIERYISAARKISRIAVGDPKVLASIDQYAVARGAGQMDQVSEELPLGSRGGTAIHHYFPVDGVYTVRVLMRPGGQQASDDKPHYDIRVPVKAGPRILGVTFLKESGRAESVSPTRGRGAAPAAKSDDSLPSELDLRLDNARVKLFDVPGSNAAIDSVQIGGPYDVEGPGDTASRRSVFICRPNAAGEEGACATKILSTLARRAYRRSVTQADLQPLLKFYKAGRSAGNFESGIEMALRGMLVSPEFLFRIERDPVAAPPGSVHRISDFELASRLSFFLWSSIPDDELLKLAEKGKLADPAVLDGQVRRMLADTKSKALVTNFAGQWLYLRNLGLLRPDPDAFPDFDEGLRASFQHETELFFETILREDRSVLELLGANYTFLNERLARHYGIPDVYGSAFRRVNLTDSNRGGLLGQGSVLMVTSYPNRTSVVQRGKWILENLLGNPPPPPPPDIPDLKAHGEDGKQLTMRQQMEAHRANAVCASCHSRMDPLGFALENFDGVGKWRDKDAGSAIDASGVLPGGVKFTGPAELKKILLTRHDEFVATLSGKLLTYALGRGIEYYDQPAVRTIARQAALDDYRMSTVVTSIVKSTPFQMRRKPE